MNVHLNQMKDLKCFINIMEIQFYNNMYEKKKIILFDIENKVANMEWIHVKYLYELIFMVRFVH